MRDDVADACGVAVVEIGSDIEREPRRRAGARRGGGDRGSDGAAPRHYCPPAMRDALTGKVAIVTGASRGIGAAIARRFAAEGARVAIVARSLEPGSGGHLAGSLAEVAARHRGRRRRRAPDRRRPVRSRRAIAPRIVAPGRGGARPGRRAGQQRGGVLLPLDRRDVRAAPAGRVRGQRDHAVPAREGGGAGDARAGRGLDRQHRER